jgi:hypothetical protein
LFCAILSLSLKGRFSGSGFSTVAGPFVTPSVCAALLGVPWSCAGNARTPRNARASNAEPETQRQDVAIVGTVLLIPTHIVERLPQRDKRETETCPCYHLTHIEKNIDW